MAQRRVALADFLREEDLSGDKPPPAIVGGMQSMPDEDVIKDPSYQKERGYFSKSCGTWGLNLKNEPYRRTIRPDELYAIKERHLKEVEAAAERRAVDLQAKMRAIGDVEGNSSVMGVRLPKAGGSSSAPLAASVVKRSQSETALPRPSTADADALPAVTIAVAPEDYKGDIGAISRLQQRPGLGFYPSGQAERRREIRKRALVTSVGPPEGAAAALSPSLHVSKSTRRPESDEEAIERRVRASFGSQSLSCPMMGLTSIPAPLMNSFYAQTGCLCELYLADNKLPTVPASFLMNVKTLKVLVLKRNHISTLPAELGQLTRLTRLDLSDNRLFQLPVSVQYLTNLVELYTSNNNIKKLPAMPFPSLTHLDASMNHLEQLPDAFYSCTSLTTLDLTNNSLMSLAIFNPVHAEEDPNLQLVPSDWETVKDPYTGGITYANRKTAVVSRADPARLLEAAKQMYKDAWEFTTTLWDKEEDAPQDGSRPAESDPKEWKEVFDPTVGAPYWFNATTGSKSWDVPVCVVEARAAAEKAAREAADANFALRKFMKENAAAAATTAETSHGTSSRETATGGAMMSEALMQNVKSELSRLAAIKGPDTPQTQTAAGGASKGKAALWSEKKGRPRKAVLTPRDEPKKDEDDEDGASVESKEKFDHTAKGIQATFTRQAEMRLLCLMHQGRGDWEAVQDKNTGTVLYRNNVTKELFKNPPLESNRFGDLIMLKRLRLGRNKLSDIPDCFGQLEQLRELYMNDNFLNPESFPPSFGDLEITFLDVRNNQIRTFPKPFAHFKYLTSLDMRGNKIAKIERGLLKLTTLETLYLSQNRLHELPTEFEVLSKLKHLEIGDNPMHPEWHRAISKGLPYLYHHCRQVKNERKNQGKPPEMEYVEFGIAGEATVTKAEVDKWFNDLLKTSQRSYVLRLQFKGLSFLPAEIFHLRNVRELDITGNELSEMPGSLQAFENLRVLRWRGNKTKRIHDDVFRSMTALRDLCLEQNFIKLMPDSFTCLTTLVMLRLSANRLMELPNNLGQIMPSLSEMWVENNRLRALPDSLGYFTTLHLLVAHTNKITHLPYTMRDLTALKSLRVQSNRLSEFPRHIMHLTTMHEINLASNRIQEIPREFLFNNMAMTIKRMYLQNNFLVQIPLGLHWMSAITELRLDNNPSLRSPPQTVTLGGVSSIMAYSAVRSRNIRHLIDHALKYQFCILQSRLTPKAEKVLTGGVGLLAQHDLDEFDDNVDKIVNTACHETNKDTIPRLINDFRDRRQEYFRSLHNAVYKKFLRALELCESEGWVDDKNFSTKVLRPFGPRHKFTRCYAISLAAMFGAGVPEGETFLESDECVSARMEQRAKSGDKTCEGPRLTPWLLSSALYYQRGILGRLANVGDWVDYHPESPDFIPAEIDPMEPQVLQYYTYDKWEKKQEEGKKPTPAEEENEDAAERTAYEGFVRPSRLKFSMKPKLPKAAWWRPRQKLSYVHVYHEWVAKDLENEESEEKAYAKVQRSVLDDTKWGWRTIDGQTELQTEMKEKRAECEETIDTALKRLNKQEINLATVNQAAVQRLMIRQSLFTGLGQVKFPEPDPEAVRRASTLLRERERVAATKGAGSAKAIWNPKKEVVGESGGGRDDAIRRARLDTLWRVGMEVTREEIHKALLKQGLTRDDTNGIDKDIYTGIKRVVEAKRDRELARKELEAAINSPVNKAIGPSYRKLVMEMITNARVDTALRQFVATQRIRAMEKGAPFRWWDGVDGSLFEEFKKKVLVVTENSKTKFVPPDDPNARLTSLAQKRELEERAGGEDSDSDDEDSSQAEDEDEDEAGDEDEDEDYELEEDDYDEDEDDDEDRDDDIDSGSDEEEDDDRR